MTLMANSLWKHLKKMPRLYCSWLEKNLEAFGGINDLQDTSFVRGSDMEMPGSVPKALQ